MRTQRQDQLDQELGGMGRASRQGGQIQNNNLVMFYVSNSALGALQRLQTLSPAIPETTFGGQK